MTKRTKPDANQKEIEEAVNLCPGFRFLDTHNVPYNLPELAGFPDAFAVSEDALVIIAQNPDRVKAFLGNEPDITIVTGAMIPIEIKTETGKLEDSQKAFASIYGVKPLVIRSIDRVFDLFRRGIE